MHFLHQPLTWGFFLVLLPVLIHLINLMRQQRVEWAAMEFLLHAYKKRRNWIWLKQFLLLLCRMLAIAAVVAMLAKMVTRQQWTTLFGGKINHHFVLLDDSLSMSERLGGGTAFDRAVKVVGRLATQAADESTTQGATRFTLVRYSRAAALSTTDADGGMAEGVERFSADIADFGGEIVGPDFAEQWSECQGTLQVSELAVGPEPALGLLTELVGQYPDEKPIVHIVSDFRADPWMTPREVGVRLAELEPTGAAVNLIRCVESDQGNLAITEFEPARGTRAAGVPLFVELSVRNYGSQPAEQVSVALRSIFHGDDTTVDDPRQSRGVVEELPDVLFDRIPPGETVTRRAQVFFPTAGQHVVHAELPADSVAADNHRWCVVHLPAHVSVLVIDGSPQGINAEYLTSVFQPSERVETGIRPSVQTMAYLRDADIEALSQYTTVYLLDCDTLDAVARRHLEQYVQQGGGVGIFLGPNSQPTFYRSWYGDGDGLFPVPIQRLDLLEPSLDDSPDMVVEDHPLFQVLAGQRNTFLGRIRVQQYHRTRHNWRPPEDSTIRVLARLRNGQPLVVERVFGDGRVVAMLSTAAPNWNSWATEPTFVVFLLELQSHLQRRDRQDVVARVTGTPLEVQLETAKFHPEVTFLVPGRQPDEKEVVMSSAATAPASDSPLATVHIGGQRDSQTSGPTDRSGVHEAWLKALDGTYDVIRYAINVDTRESDLAFAIPEQMADSLPIKNLRLASADEVLQTADDPRYFALGQLILVGLLVLLLVEQLVSYSCSYHLSRGAA